MITKHCIVVAEDDPDEVFLLRWAFKQAGFDHEFIDLNDGEVTIEYLNGTPPYDDRVRFPLPKLLILDLKMPKRNGFEVLAWMAARPDLKSMPVVVLSSSQFGDDAQMAKKLGAQEFLTKPHDLNDLVKLVKEMHDRWLVSEQPMAPTISSEAENQPFFAARA
jgi:DNA-binding response OmpR family regulator